VLQRQNRSGLPRARARFLAQAIQLEEEEPSGIVRAAVWFTACMLIAAVLWARATHLAEVTIAPGEVVPAGLIHEVQHLEGGIVSEMRVRNGDRVRKGELLLRFAPPASRSEYEQALIRKGALQLESERLQAIIEQREPDFGETGLRFPDLARKQSMIYQAQWANFQSGLRVIDAQIRQRKTELVRQQNQAEAVRREIRLLQEQVSIRSRLEGDKLVSRTELISTQTRLAEAESERGTIDDGVIVARSALEEAQQRRQEYLTGSNEEMELEAGRVTAQLAEVEQSLVGLKDRVSRLDIHAPVDGIVQALTITRINAVVEPGQVIMQVVPVDDDLVVEARISPSEIGHIHVGQPTEVKVDSFDYARFGSVSGRVSRISASTYLDEKRNPYYLAEVELGHAWVGRGATRMAIIPGMTVQADIKTGSKTILDYLLKPISRGFDSSFHER
jgi:HlyD family type I secretion membrane fusion protein